MCVSMHVCVSATTSAVAVHQPHLEPAPQKRRSLVWWSIRLRTHRSGRGLPSVGRNAEAQRVREATPSVLPGAVTAPLSSTAAQPRHCGTGTAAGSPAAHPSWDPNIYPVLGRVGNGRLRGRKDVEVVPLVARPAPLCSKRRKKKLQITTCTFDLRSSSPLPHHSGRGCPALAESWAPQAEPSLSLPRGPPSTSCWCLRHGAAVCRPGWVEGVLQAKRVSV